MDQTPQSDATVQPSLPRVQGYGTLVDNWQTEVPTPSTAEAWRYPGLRPELYGKKLYRLSHAVPNLLAPEDHIARLSEVEKEAGTLSTIRVNKRSLLGNTNDRAFFSILKLAETHYKQRSSDQEGWLRPFSVTDDKVECWKGTGSESPPTRTTINLNQYTAMLREWHHSKRFFDAEVEDNRTAVANWADILDMMRNRVAPEHISAAIFQELMTLYAEDANKLKKRVDELYYTGVYKTGSIGVNTRRTHVDPNALYAKRFSHKHPLGKVINDKERALRKQSLAVHRKQRSTIGNSSGSRRPTTCTATAAQANKIKISIERIEHITKNTIMIVVGSSILAAIIILCFFKLGNKEGNRFDY